MIYKTKRKLTVHLQEIQYLGCSHLLTLADFAPRCVKACMIELQLTGKLKCRHQTIKLDYFLQLDLLRPNKNVCYNR